MPRLASAAASLGTRRTRPRPTAAAQASVTPRSGSATADTSPRVDADAAATLSRPRAAHLLDLQALVSVAGVGLLGSSPFTLAGDPATDTLLPVGDLTLDSLSGETPAGIGILESGPIASATRPVSTPAPSPRRSR